jgi:drug/metabolite transporter (DMT)-like permease
MGVLFAFGVFEMGLGLVLFTAGAQRVPPVEAAMIAILESILSPFWVWIFLGENPGLRTILGGAVVIAAVTVHTIGDLRSERPAPAAQDS